MPAESRSLRVQATDSQMFLEDGLGEGVQTACVSESIRKEEEFFLGMARLLARSHGLLFVGRPRQVETRVAHDMLQQVERTIV